MKSLLKLGILTFLTLFATSTMTSAQDRAGKKARPSPNAAVSQTVGTSVVSVTYGRPGLKGRPLESLTPTGKVWRTGANESTAITFSGDVMVGDKAIKAGTYSLYTIPGNKKWTIIINSKMSWGTQYDESMDVARTSASVSEGSQTEWFTIDFDNLSDSKAHMNLRWGNQVVAVPITVK